MLSPSSWPSVGWRPAARPPWAASLLPVAVVALDTVLFSALTVEDNRGTFVLVSRPEPVLVVAAALPMVPLAMARVRFPLTATLALAGYAVLLTTTIGSRPLATVLLALYALAARAALRRSAVGLLANLAAHGVTVAYETSRSVGVAPVVATATVFALFDLVTWLLGARAYRGRMREVQLLRDSRRVAAEAVAAERSRIARELHDVVANAVTVIVLQAAGARPMVATAPELVARALEAIEQAADQAMTELRQLLVVLRAVADVVDEPGITLPGLAGVGVLLQQAESSGLVVDFRAEGDVADLDRSVDLAAYRIIQEALTNVTRHAGTGSRAWVQVHRGSGEVVVDIRDDGAGRPAGIQRLSTGSGLVGIRERVNLLGGQLSCGVQNPAGWRVRARLPVRTVAGVP